MQQKQDATVTVAIARIAQIIQSYSLGGAYMYFVQYTVPCRPKRHLNRFSRFAGITVVTNSQTHGQTDRQTDDAACMDIRSNNQSCNHQVGPVRRVLSNFGKPRGRPTAFGPVQHLRLLFFVGLGA